MIVENFMKALFSIKNNKLAQKRHFLNFCSIYKECAEIFGTNISDNNV